MLFNKCDSFIIKVKQTSASIAIAIGNSTTTQYKSLKFMQETCHLDYFIGLISVTSIICICLITAVYLWKYNYFGNVTRGNEQKEQRTNDNVENGLRREFR